jgi:hypothetical protein
MGLKDIKPGINKMYNRGFYSSIAVTVGK